MISMERFLTQIVVISANETTGSDLKKKIIEGFEERKVVNDILKM